MSKGLVTDVQRFSVHDGPGIRTLIFLKGCPLACPWCSNPETKSLENELVHADFKCIDCGNCVGECPEHAIKTPGKSFVDGERCTLCLACVTACPTGAMSLAGKEMTAPDILAIVEKDRLFYENSGGGVTFSGGEPFVQHQFLGEALVLLKNENFHTAVETTGCVEWSVIDRLRGFVDLFLYDLKVYRETHHLALTGTGNARILDNLKKLSNAGAQITIRVPIVPGLTDSNGNLIEIAQYVASCSKVRTVHLLPFHNMGKKKYGQLGKEYTLGDAAPPSRERMEELKEIFASRGFECMIGG
jgi:pyruvate formate lyase activating enzyme